MHRIERLAEAQSRPLGRRLWGYVADPADMAEPKPRLKDRLKELLVEYGTLALWIYLAIFAMVWVGFAAAIQFGIKVNGALGSAGIWGAAYVATKLTQPLRILGTLAMTPAVAALLHRRRTREKGKPSPGSEA